jgi:hypothetical protein
MGARHQRVQKLDTFQACFYNRRCERRLLRRKDHEVTSSRHKGRDEALFSFST